MKKLPLIVVTAMLATFLSAAITNAGPVPKTTTIGVKPVPPPTVNKEVSAENPQYLRWDAQSKEWVLRLFVNIPNQVNWEGKVGRGAPTVSLGCLETTGGAPLPNPKGVRISDTVWEFRFVAFGKQRVNLPIRTSDGATGWGFIHKSPASVFGTDNGYRYQLNKDGTYSYLPAK